MAGNNVMRKRLWLIATIIWSMPALLFSTQQWAALQDTPKEMSWIAAFLYQAPSWLLLIPASVLLLHVVRRYPIDRRHMQRIALHAVLSIAFGVLFLMIAVPVRHAFHPSPVRWSFFGDMFFKSAPQFVLIGIGAYWLVILIASLLETRQRLAATIESIEAVQPEAREANTNNTPPKPSNWRITLNTPGGRMVIPTIDIEWAEPASMGARLHTADEVILVRHSLAELENRLKPSGFLRIHRSVLVNTAAVREVRGAASRDGFVLLESGRKLPVTRRRRPELDALLTPQLA